MIIIISDFRYLINFNIIRFAVVKNINIETTRQRIIFDRNSNDNNSYSVIIDEKRENIKNPFYKPLLLNNTNFFFPIH